MPWKKKPPRKRLPRVSKTPIARGKTASTTSQRWSWACGTEMGEQVKENAGAESRRAPGTPKGRKGRTRLLGPLRLLRASDARSTTTLTFGRRLLSEPLCVFC
jgi:hypothetical protein